MIEMAGERKIALQYKKIKWPFYLICAPLPIEGLVQGSSSFIFLWGSLRDLQKNGKN
jgi:hypothetical protein